MATKVVVDTRGFCCGHCQRSCARDFFGEWAKDIRGQRTDDTPSIDMCHCGKMLCRRCNKKYQKLMCPNINPRRAELLLIAIGKVIRIPKKKAKRIHAALLNELEDRTKFAIWHPLHQIQN